jgi:hypothetical protein
LLLTWGGGGDTHWYLIRSREWHKRFELQRILTSLRRGQFRDFSLPTARGLGPKNSSLETY